MLFINYYIYDSMTPYSLIETISMTPEGQGTSYHTNNILYSTVGNNILYSTVG